MNILLQEIKYSFIKCFSENPFLEKYRNQFDSYKPTQERTIPIIIFGIPFKLFFGILNIISIFVFLIIALISFIVFWPVSEILKYLFER